MSIACETLLSNIQCDSSDCDIARCHFEKMLAINLAHKAAVQKISTAYETLLHNQRESGEYFVVVSS